MRDIPWSTIEYEYVTGDCSLNSLAEKFGITSATISTFSRKNDWSEKRKQFRAETSEAAYAHAKEAAINDRMMLYQATREASQNIIMALLEASKQAKQLHLHVCQREESTFDFESKSKTTSKWVEDKELERVDGRNAADIARAIKDLASMARVLDDLVDPYEKAKLDLDREKLELDKRKAGMGDDIESESGIALLPGVDESLLEGALPDPDGDGVTE